MNILAIDPAMTTGFACNKASGVFLCKAKGRQSLGYRFILFRNYIKALIEDNDIDFVVYEKPSGKHFTGIRSHSNFEGVLLELCEDLKIEYKEVVSTEIKRYAKSISKVSGIMDKSAMFSTAIDFIQPNVIDDNHADALWLLQYANNLLT